METQTISQESLSMNKLWTDDYIYLLLTLERWMSRRLYLYIWCRAAGGLFPNAASPPLSPNDSSCCSCQPPWLGQVYKQGLQVITDYDYNNVANSQWRILLFKNIYLLVNGELYYIKKTIFYSLLLLNYCNTLSDWQCNNYKII